MQYVQPDVWKAITTDYKYNHLDKVKKRLANVVQSYLCDIICETLEVQEETITTSIRMSQFGDDSNLSAILYIPKLRNMFEELIQEYIHLVKNNVHSKITYHINTEKQILTFEVHYA